jgi:hypothetical protein
LFVCWVDSVGMEAVATISLVLTIFVLSPFVVEVGVVHKWHTEEWGRSAKDIQWSLFVSTLLWNVSC